MRYQKSLLIAGAIRLNDIELKELEEEQRKNLHKEQEILQTYNDDQPKIERIAREIVTRAENGMELSTEFLQAPFAVKVDGRWGQNMRTLGLNVDYLNKTQALITRTEEQINRLKGPIPLVEFLNSIEDDMVSDYGLHQAGFDVKTSALVTAGLEVQRATEAAKRQATQEG